MHPCGEPVAKGGEDLHDGYDVGVLVEFLHRLGGLDDFVGCPVVGIEALVYLLEHLDDKFLAADGLGGTKPLPSPILDPFVYGLGRYTDTFGDSLLAIALEVIKPCQLALFVELVLPGLFDCGWLFLFCHRKRILVQN